MGYSHPQYQSGHHAGPGVPPELPPKIDRSSKPTRLRSAQERLFGSREGDVGGNPKNGDSSESYGSPPPPAPPNGSSQPESSLNFAGPMRGSSVDRERAAAVPVKNCFLLCGCHCG